MHKVWYMNGSTCESGSLYSRASHVAMSELSPWVNLNRASNLIDSNVDLLMYLIAGN